LRQSGIGYVSSIFTFGNFVGQAQRIRFPRETLSLNAANCIDVSVVFASTMENLGMKPVIVILPGHAITGVRLGPDSSDILYLDLTVLPNGTFEQAIARGGAVGGTVCTETGMMTRSVERGQRSPSFGCRSGVDVSGGFGVSLDCG